MSKPLRPCGTYDARRRHAYNNETCPTCDATARTLSPCGTRAARRRHVIRGEHCDTCAPKPRKLAPCGTYTAFKRHRGNKEPIDEACREAARAHDEARRRARGIPARSYISIDDLVTEIRFLINAGEGEHRILVATGYVGRERQLKGRLNKAGHHNLTAAIFNQWDLAA